MLRAADGSSRKRGASLFCVGDSTILVRFCIGCSVRIQPNWRESSRTFERRRENWVHRYTSRTNRGTHEGTWILKGDT